ncbi:MAG TPA: fasciclin domain-containing protein [Verrucomicrobiae bacterium]|nr:fasciclin domain-containing protein [Verrucomicrobiae bacterium]
MKNLGAAALSALLLAGAGVTVALAADPMVGGAAMHASMNIVQNAMNSKDHTTLVALVKKAGLVQTLEGPGPFTVFAPTNAAFAKLPKATVDKVTSDKPLLTKVLTYHVVAGRLSTAEIEHMIQSGGGKATLKTVEGGDLTAMMDGSNIVLVDDHGDRATITIPDVYQSNGVIDVINTVLVP